MNWVGGAGARWRQRQNVPYQYQRRAGNNSNRNATNQTRPTFLARGNSNNFNHERQGQWTSSSDNRDSPLLNFIEEYMPNHYALRLQLSHQLEIDRAIPALTRLPLSSDSAFTSTSRGNQDNDGRERRSFSEEYPIPIGRIFSSGSTVWDSQYGEDSDEDFSEYLAGATFSDTTGNSFTTANEKQDNVNTAGHPEDPYEDTSPSYSDFTSVSTESCTIVSSNEGIQEQSKT